MQLLVHMLLSYRFNAVVDKVARNQYNIGLLCVYQLHILLQLLLVGAVAEVYVTHCNYAHGTLQWFVDGDVHFRYFRVAVVPVTIHQQA